MKKQIALQRIESLEALIKQQKVELEEWKTRAINAETNLTHLQRTADRIHALEEKVMNMATKLNAIKEIVN